MDKSKLGIVIPTYNEKDNIVELLSEIQKEAKKHKIKIIVLVIDDNSPDGTSELVTKNIPTLEDNFFELRIITRPGKEGFASAYIQGFQALKDEVEFLVSMDADFSHKPEYLISMLKKIENQNLDLLVGSRYAKGGGVENWLLFRRFLSKGASIYTRTLLGINIKDLTSGFNLYRTTIFDTLNINNIKAEGYFFLVEMKYKIVKLGFKFGEFPIIFTDRTQGQSKMSKKIMIESAVGVLKLALGLNR